MQLVFAGLDARQVEDLVDQLEQMLAEPWMSPEYSL